MSITTSTGTTVTTEERHGDTVVILDNPEAPADMRNAEVGRITDGGFQPAMFGPWVALTAETLRAIAQAIDPACATAPTPTERQAATLDRIRDELRDRWCLTGHFDLAFEDEIRPGRGHTLRWVLCDGEKIAQGTLDVYGNGDFGVGDVEWTHTPEGCESDCCTDDAGEPVEPCTVCGWSGWLGSRWHDPEHHSPHIHCGRRCRPCRACADGDGFHRSSPHKAPEHKDCDCPRPVTDVKTALL